MPMLRMLTAGESHGKGLVAILEGLPAGVPVSQKELAAELARRRQGYGRGGRQKLETDRFDIVSGVRHGRTLGSPIALSIPNVEWETKYRDLMAVEGQPDPSARLTRPRPGHADLVGARNVALRTLFTRHAWVDTGCLSTSPDDSADEAKAVRLQRWAELKWSPAAGHPLSEGGC